MDTLEEYFSNNAPPSSLIDNITQTIFVNPHFLNGYTYSLSTIQGFQGVDPLTKQMFDRNSYSKNREKETEIEKYFQLQFDTINACFSNDKKIETILPILRVLKYVLCDNRTPCLNAKRIFESSLSNNDTDVMKLMEQVKKMDFKLYLDWVKLNGKKNDRDSDSDSDSDIGSDSDSDKGNQTFSPDDACGSKPKKQYDPNNSQKKSNSPDDAKNNNSKPKKSYDASKGPKKSNPSNVAGKDSSDHSPQKQKKPYNASKGPKKSGSKDASKKSNQNSTPTIDSDGNIKVEKKYSMYINKFLLAKWNEKCGPSSNITENNGVFTVSGSISNDAKGFIQSTLRNLKFETVCIPAPFSAKVYKELILSEVNKNKTFVKFNADHSTGWVSQNNNNTGSSSGNSQIEFKITGEKDKVALVKQFIEQLKHLNKSILLTGNQKDEKYNWDQYNKTKDYIIYSNFDEIRIEANSKENLSIATKIVSNELDKANNVAKVSYYKVDKESEIFLLEDKEILRNINIKYPNSVKKSDKTSIMIQCDKTKYLEIKNLFDQILNGFEEKTIDLYDGNPFKGYLISKLVKREVQKYNSSYQQNQELVSIKVSPYKGDEARLDLKSVMVYGRGDLVEKVVRILKNIKNLVYFEKYQPSNIKELLSYSSSNPQKIKDIENQFNCSISTKNNEINICVPLKEYYRAVTDEIDALIPKIPNDSKLIEINKFTYKKIKRNIDIVENEAKINQVRFNYNKFESTIKISGDPIKVLSIYNKLINAIQLFEKNVGTKVISIDKLKHDILFENKKVGELQSKTSTLIELVLKDKIVSTLTLNNGKTITLVKGNLTNQKTHAIINPANEFLKNGGGGAARAIEVAAGPTFKDSCEKYIRAHGKLNVGQACGGKEFMMGDVMVINTVGPLGSDPNRKTLLINSIQNSLSLAAKLNCQSISIPAISTGNIFNYDHKEAVPIIVNTCVENLKSSISQTIKEIRFVDLSQDIINCFEATLDGLVGYGIIKKDSNSTTINYTQQNNYQQILNSNYQPSIEIPLDYEWTWQENDGSHIPYDRDQAIQIEEAFKSRSPQVKIVGDRNQIKNGASYIVKFPDYNNRSSWYQFRTENGINKRLVQRNTLNIPISNISRTPNMIFNNNFFNNNINNNNFVNNNSNSNNNNNNNIGSNNNKNNDKFEIKVKGHVNDIALFENELEKLVKDYKYSETLDSIQITSNLSSEIKHKSLELGVKFEYDASKSRVVLEGMKQHVFEIKSIIFEKKNQIIYPKNWSKDKDNHLIPVQEGSEEWNSILKRMLETMPGVRLIKVQEVQNRSAYNDYLYKKNKIESENQGKSNELLLFHGTNLTSPETIYMSKDCFDMRYGNESSKWGKGSYFAVNASYSHGYAYEINNYQRQFFIALVLTGDSIQLASNPSIRHPPAKDPNYPTILYDSIKGNTLGSDVFIVYNNTQSYPKYLVTYQYSNQIKSLKQIIFNYNNK